MFTNHRRTRVSRRWVPVSLVVCGILATATVAPAQIVPSEFRTIDGTNNNLEHPAWGSTAIELMREDKFLFGGMDVGYADGMSSPAGPNRPSPRAISNAVVAQSQSIPNHANASGFVWQWGQFIDHDLDLTTTASPTEELDIPVPAGDPFFDPGDTGTAVIQFTRSIYEHGSAPRQQMNMITAWIDASQVYGSDDARAAELRGLRGQLKMSRGKLLPFNLHGFANANTTDSSQFLAGDVRANEQNGLTAMHTLFVREHNRIVRDLQRVGSFDSEARYQIARAVVAAQIQSITYNEFLPALLGPNALQPYTGYKPNVDPAITNAFSTAAFRFGHSMLPTTLLRLQANGSPIKGGPLALRDAFFNPREISRWGIEPLLRGLAVQPAQEIDSEIVDDVRNFLFGPPGAGGFDLASLNIQRGRDHGLPSYVQMRMDFGLSRPIRSFADITSDPVLQDRLASVYASVNDVDAWVGGLAEDHVPGAMVGSLIYTVLTDQFQRVRDGDRFWYETYLPTFLRERYVDGQTLADIIRRNTSIRTEIPDDVFHVQ